MFNIDNKLSLIETGSWGEFQGSKFLVTHISNLRFQRTLARLQQPYKKRIEQGTLDPATSKDVMCKAMAEALITDWQDVVDGSGQKVQYSAEAAYKALTNDPEFRDFVTEFATNLQNFRDEEVKNAGKS